MPGNAGARTGRRSNPPRKTRAPRLPIRRRNTLRDNTGDGTGADMRRPRYETGRRSPHAEHDQLAAPSSDRFLRRKRPRRRKSTASPGTRAPSESRRPVACRRRAFRTLVFIFMHSGLHASSFCRCPPPWRIGGFPRPLRGESAYARNDKRAPSMEKVAIDLGQWVRHAREVLGYAKVVPGRLVGWTGLCRCSTRHRP